MKRSLVRTAAFIRAAKRVLRKNPEAQESIEKTLRLLHENVQHPFLRSHKLTGRLRGSLACSAGYDLRIVFSFVKLKGKQAILLETIGTHDEVY